jgi:hypothetical protein
MSPSSVNATEPNLAAGRAYYGGFGLIPTILDATIAA